MTRGAWVRYAVAVGPPAWSQVALPGRPAATASAAVCWLFQGQRQSRRGDVRVTTAFNRMLGLPGAWVRDVEFGAQAMIVTVAFVAAGN